MPSYDPIKVSQKIKKIVVRDDQRKYYRFRKARFYGGIATADCVGCNLQCCYCWSNKPRKRPREVGKFYSPKEVAEKLGSIAMESGLSQVRISGNEPTIGRKHLISTLHELQEHGLKFILETNGILIGADLSYASDIAKFGNVHTRVSLKGCDEKQFSKLTGADPESFELQIRALQNLLDSGGDCHASIVEEFASKEKLDSLKRRLERVDLLLARELELESLILYPHVKKQLKDRGISIPSSSTSSSSP
ncbi:hypothetical protein AKJ58_00050 [candidate division MSBL1 archaeon SCGC-AAA385D11]|uniref:Radical SAM core domain-containing protein n=1 Tax=candidate division MSBL1 archaeon SCGC-AAA385D11 TaxID=1698286 RepID=A0A133VPP0_9EURY|nr:hypothetical protein AKJ58_00050 [candidate division MSBL1 archaeon SCGC-AAA385D11]